MKEYQLEIKQTLDYPRCRIYREFVHTLLDDRKLRLNSTSHLFHYTILCCYANFRTSYLRLDGTTYTIRPGEWICRITDLLDWFRVRFQHQAMTILDVLQQLHLITYTRLGCGNLIKYHISYWHRHNPILDYNCPCQKDTGFFFIPLTVLSKLIGSSRASEMDIVLDLWLCTIYQDERVLGSDIGPVVYYRNGTGNPLISYTELAQRWKRSRSSVGRLLKKLSDNGYLSLLSFPGRCGSVIYLSNYLSVMFQISDAVILKRAVASSLKIQISLADESELECPPHQDRSVLTCVSDESDSIPKSYILFFASKIAEALASQGLFCFHCEQAHIKLSVLSDDCEEKVSPPSCTQRPITRKMELTLSCASGSEPIHLVVIIECISTTFDWRSQNGCKA